MRKWYIIHTQTGNEDRVKVSILNRIKAKGLKELIGEIFVPTEQVSEVKAGKKRLLQRKFFPGYILINMELNDETYILIKTTPGVTGFIGLSRKPSTLSEKEVEQIIQRTQETKSKPSPKIIFENGEAVRVIDGPFMNFNGVIEEVYPEKGKLKVGVSIFGRSTPVELEYWQVEKI